MGGVDLSDNLLCHFTTERNRMKKFYKKMLRHLLDMAVLNSFITYKNLGGKMKRIDFIIELSENIISKYSRSLPVPSTCGGRLTAKLHRLLSRHFPKYCPLTKKREKTIRNCAECRKTMRGKALHIGVKIVALHCVLCHASKTGIPSNKFLGLADFEKCDLKEIKLKLK